MAIKVVIRATGMLQLQCWWAAEGGGGAGVKTVVRMVGGCSNGSAVDADMCC